MCATVATTPSVTVAWTPATRHRSARAPGARPGSSTTTVTPARIAAEQPRDPVGVLPDAECDRRARLDARSREGAGTGAHPLTERAAREGDPAVVANERRLVGLVRGDDPIDEVGERVHGATTSRP